MDRFDNIWLASTEPNMGSNPAPETSQMPTPLTPAAVVEIYSRDCSPDPSNAEAIEPRQYHPTAIDVDAQLKFPDREHIGIDDVDQEDLAHVQEIQQDVVEEVIKLATVLESNYLFPPFSKLRNPPTHVINA